MNFEISEIMMFFFILLFIISIKKIYVFLPNEQLPDDDTTHEAQEKLMNIVKKYIQQDEKVEDVKVLLQKVQSDEDFDKEHFWRFNENKLNQLLVKMKKY